MSVRLGLRFTRLLIASLAAPALLACGGGSPPIAPDQGPAADQAEQQIVEPTARQSAPAPAERTVEPPDEARDETFKEQSKDAEPAPQDEPRNSSAGLAGGGAPDPYDADYTFAVLQTLAGEIGARFTGDPGERETVNFLAAELGDLGYEVSVEPFSFESKGGLHSIEVFPSEGGGFHSRLPVILMEPSNGAALGVQGRIVFVPGLGTAEDFAAVDAEQAIAVVARGVLTFSQKQRNAEAAGAAALIVVNNADELFSGRLERSGQIPVYAVSSGFGESLKEQNSGRGKFTVTEAMERRSWNVVARLPGGVCRVVVGSHYDTVPGVTGANDNASGTATMLSLARSWADASSADDVCFIGFGAEELGLHGSDAFVNTVRETGDLEQISTMLNLDALGGGRYPITLIGDPKLAAVMHHLAQSLGIDAEIGGLPPSISSDHLPFQQAGVEVIFPFVPGGIVHTPADNLAAIDWALLEDIGLLAHAMLECLLEQAGSDIEPRLACEAA